MATTIRVWPVPRVPARKPDILKDSSAKSQWVCMKCKYIGHSGNNICTQCGNRLINLGTRVKAPKKGDTRGWRELLVAYSHLIYPVYSDIYPCNELRELNFASFGKKEPTYEQKRAVLEKWVIALDKDLERIRNKS